MENRNLPPVTTSDSNDLTLRSMPLVEGDWKTCANVKFRAVNGKVKINVYMNNVQHESYDITIRYREALGFLKECLSVIDGKIGGVGTVKHSPRRKGKEVSREVYPDGSVDFVRQPDGIFTMLLSHPKCPVQVVCAFRPDKFLRYTDGKGNELPDQEQSRIFALGQIVAITDILPLTINESDKIRRVNAAGVDGKPKDRQAIEIFLSKQTSGKSGGGGSSSGGSYSNDSSGGGYSGGGNNAYSGGSSSGGGYSGDSSGGGYTGNTGGYSGTDVFTG